MNYLPPEAPEEGYDRTESGLFVPNQMQPEKPNHDTRRQITKQIKRYNRQQTREMTRRLARQKEKNA